LFRNGAHETCQCLSIYSTKVPLFRKPAGLGSARLIFFESGRKSVSSMKMKGWDHYLGGGVIPRASLWCQKYFSRSYRRRVKPSKYDALVDLTRAKEKISV